MKVTEAERDSFYKVLFSRRDVRREFLPTPIPKEVLDRILLAAHHAPSVGFMQPWDFVVVSSKETKQKIKQGFQQANQQSADMFDGERKEKYQTLKLEGIEEAPIGICLTCDRSRTGDIVLGKTIKPEMDLYSAVCAAQNLWLAARAENIGVGWVSILLDDVLRENLAIPESLDIIGYFCLGYVEAFQDTPDLERHGWQSRREVKNSIHFEKWQK
ncbi:5,6-dimethylbenzimidazole synthase [Marinomonas mediterranea]|jgi:cob(II)yrinic acid a,c-diamide reductase (EC 1.16.8.1)|uniref:5,6-dimethylbenzimidazole synthase n=1 Tax=Marinomonas mediterranea (strain ATCC 700492 / JCM 21426 / NBRC 103028 / MMB-1) TaxID=717774 RepID=F2K2X2_MARM1|nr:5,6-dimethylbenzimidazole synthase [Marinomonas mediterranea]ADZ92361.1 cob(II)yrinic acid a,c-diamide reductase [Marinomonas mediterranea MMB-1]WCN18410.1 5,6-dimethylbenzimidazole synthase [Marinomonas mediterranea MMB-1]